MNKPSFVMYVEHGEQMEDLTMEQRGMWITAIYDYVRYGKAEIADPVVKMLFTTNRQHLERDAKKYEEKIRKCSEAGKRGGRPRKDETEYFADEEKGLAFAEKPVKRKKADNENESVYDNENANVYVNVYEDVDESVYENVCENVAACETVSDIVREDDDDLYRNQTGRPRLPRCSGQKERQEEAQGLIYYGENQIPTTRAELAKSDALARTLFGSYLQKTPGPYDREKVFSRCYRVAETADGRNYAEFSEAKAELLRFVMKQAAEQGNVTWRYIDGIYDNYEQRGIQTAEQAQENEYRWNRGEVV